MLTMEAKIRFRKASWRDCLFLYRLRNQPEVYKYFRNNFPVEFPTHIVWFVKLMLGISKKKLVVIEVYGKKTGQIRFDRVHEECADISISILKEHMKHGIMSSIFPEVAKSYLVRNREVKKLTAHIKYENASSIKFFEKMKFRCIGKENSEWVYLKTRDEIIQN